MIGARSTLVGTLCGLLRRAEAVGLYYRDDARGEVKALRRYYRSGQSRRGAIRRIAEELLRNLHAVDDSLPGRGQCERDVEALLARMREGDRAILRASAREPWGEPDERDLGGDDNHSGSAGSDLTAQGHGQRLLAPGGSRGPSMVARPSFSAAHAHAAEGAAEGSGHDRELDQGSPELAEGGES